MIREGVVACGSPQSAAAAESVFRQGGNSTDAALAASYATAAGDPSITSLAGGGIWIHHDGGSGRTSVCDFFGNAPGLGGRRAGGGKDLPPLDFHDWEVDFQVGGTRQRFYGGRGAAAVPGVLAGLAAIRDRWGTLPLEPLVRPAITVLREGFPLSEYQVACIEFLKEILGRSPLGRKLFFESGADRLLRAGHRFRNPRLADFLERLSIDGYESVFEKVLIPAILSKFGEEQGGWITREDLLAYEPIFREPLRVDYGGARVLTHPAPAYGGPLVALTLALFERARVRETAPGSSERLHRLAAVFRAVSEERAGEPDLAHRPEAGAVLDRRLRAILEGESTKRAGREPRLPGNTTHISTADREGNADSVTLSYGEGNGFEIPQTGIFMNNFLGEEDLFPGGFHRFRPGKRLSTMMAPAIVERPGGGLAALGSGGSNRIRTVVPQVISALLDDGEEPEAAVRRGRIHFEDGILSAESYLIPGGEGALAKASRLAATTRTFERSSLFFGGVHLACWNSGGRLEGAGDPRRGGEVRVVR